MSNLMFDGDIESAIVELVNKRKKKPRLKLKKYQKINDAFYNQDVLTGILEKGKFTDIGNVYDFPKDLPQPQALYGGDMVADYKLFNRIAVSKKLNSVVYYSVSEYAIYCTFLVDIKHLEEYFKLSKETKQYNSSRNPFRDVDFDCKPGEFIEISHDSDEGVREYSSIKRKVTDEHLVFENGSKLSEIMEYLKKFFEPETEKLYQDLELPYKRGIIIHSDPGNGKSSMIREIIRTTDTASKIIINSNSHQVTKLLRDLTRALKGRKVIVIIEDIDSLVTDENRSDFLNTLDGVNINSGIFFIGTTNYPGRIDPAFVNRGGRFDKTYAIDNPTDNTRRLFFNGKNINTIFAKYRSPKDSTSNDIAELFVKHSSDLPMSSLKELITIVAYILANNTDITLEQAVITASNTMKMDRNSHKESHKKFKHDKHLQKLREAGIDVSTLEQATIEPVIEPVKSIGYRRVILKPEYKDKLIS